MKDTSILSVKDYIKKIPKEQRSGFEELREIILNHAPDAIEGMSYGMPSLKYHGMLIYYASHTNHYAIYPMASPIIVFKEQLAGYETSKGTVKFPHGKALPKKLITDIVKFRVKENKEKFDLKKKKK
jgi:uncharacterized protein YdhG (YjbR/CyaY superfamily)